MIAASDGRGLLSERLDGRRSGFHHDRSGTLWRSHATLGYENAVDAGLAGIVRTLLESRRGWNLTLGAHV